MDLSWVSLKLDSEMSPSLLPPWESVGHSQGLWALRQCWEGVGLSTKRWYGDGVDGSISIPGSKPHSRKGMGWNVCGNGVKTWPTIIIYLICYYIGNPSLIGSFDYIQLASNFHKAMLIGWEWLVQIVLINFGTQVLLRSIALRSLTVEGFVPMLEFGDLIFKLFWMNATFDSTNATM